MARKTIAQLEGELDAAKINAQEVRAEAEHYKRQDEDVRRELTGMLITPQLQKMTHPYDHIFMADHRSTDSYTRDKKEFILSWAQIFFELGKVVNKADYLNLAILEQDFGTRIQKIEDIIHPDKDR